MFLVWPYTYHSGFNHGYNMAEAINMATLNWIPRGEEVTKCDCKKNKMNLGGDERRCLPNFHGHLMI